MFHHQEKGVINICARNFLNSFDRTDKQLKRDLDLLNLKVYWIQEKLQCRLFFLVIVILFGTSWFLGVCSCCLQLSQEPLIQTAAPPKVLSDTSATCEDDQMIFFLRNITDRKRDSFHFQQIAPWKFDLQEEANNDAAYWSVLSAINAVCPLMRGYIPLLKVTKGRKGTLMDSLTPSKIFFFPIHYHKDYQVPSRPESLQASISNATPADWRYPPTPPACIWRHIKGITLFHENYSFSSKVIWLTILTLKRTGPLRLHKCWPRRLFDKWEKPLAPEAETKFKQ